MNILITSAGRQVFLVNAFKKALGYNGKIYTSDYNKDAPALTVSDKGFTSPAFTSDNYISWLINLCQVHRVNLLITLSVDDLLILEKSRDLFEKQGVLLIGGKIPEIKKTHDKYLLSHFCKKIGLKVPKTVLIKDSGKNKLCYPLLAKPRYGQGSIGHKRIKNDDDLAQLIYTLNENSPTSSYILQEFVNGQEYGIDVINYFNSKYAGVLVRKKIQMKNGETFEAITESQVDWEKLANILGSKLKHQGIVDVDIIVSNGEKYIIDINHRFGGGYIFCHVAGANIPKAYLNWSKQIEAELSCMTYRLGVHSKRNGLGIDVLD